MPAEPPERAPLLLRVFSTFAVDGPQIRGVILVDYFGPALACNKYEDMIDIGHEVNRFFWTPAAKSPPEKLSQRVLRETMDEKLA